MRLISQDGETDVSYELCEIYIVYKWKRGTNKNEIMGYQINSVRGESEHLLAFYSTKEKALEIMEDIRNKWVQDLAFYKFPADEKRRVNNQ